MMSLMIYTGNEVSARIYTEREKGLMTKLTKRAFDTPPQLERAVHNQITKLNVYNMKMKPCSYRIRKV